jgi:hypothetical protein
MMQTSSRIRHAKQRRSRNQPAPAVWLQSILETAALYVLPLTLLILIGLIVLGISGQSFAHLEPGSDQTSSLFALAPTLMGGAA